MEGKKLSDSAVESRDLLMPNQTNPHETARGGIVIAIKDQLDIPVKFVGLGEKPEDIAEFDPEKFVEALFD
jgi:signal recognition particle GTPase